MTWLFSKAMMESCENSRSFPAPEEESLEATCSDGEPFAQLNVMPTQAKFWRNDKTMEFSSLSRFGLTLRLLTESRGETVLMSFLADFPVRTLVPQEKAQELTEAAQDFGRTWDASFAKYDQTLCMWKTAQYSLLGDLAEMGFDAQWGVVSAADTDAPHLRERIWILANACGRRFCESETRQMEQPWRAASFGSSDVGTDFMRKGSSIPGQEQDRAYGKQSGRGFATSNRWPAEPGMVRMVHGVPYRVDRIKALGNAQVPKVAATAFTYLSNE